MSYADGKKALTNSIINEMASEARSIVKTTRAMADSGLANIQRTSFHEGVLTFYAGDIHDDARRQNITGTLKILARSYEDFERIVLLDHEGRVVASSAEVVQVGSNLAETAIVQEALQGKTLFSPFIKSPLTGKMIMAVLAPVRVSGRIAGVAYATIDLEVFYEQHIKSVRIGPSGFAYMLDGQGMVVLPPAQHQNWAYKTDLPLRHLYAEWASGSPSGFETVIGNAGYPAFLYYLKEPLTNMIAVVHAPQEEVFPHSMNCATAIL